MPPEWLLQQFPVAATVLVTAWLVLRWTDRQQRRELARVDAQTKKDEEQFQLMEARYQSQFKELTDQFRPIASGLDNATKGIAELKESQVQALAEFQAQLSRLEDEYKVRLKEKDTQIARLVRQLNKAIKGQEGEE